MQSFFFDILGLAFLYFEVNHSVRLFLQLTFLFVCHGILYIFSNFVFSTWTHFTDLWSDWKNEDKFHVRRVLKKIQCNLLHSKRSRCSSMSTNGVKWWERQVHCGLASHRADRWCQKIINEHVDINCITTSQIYYVREINLIFKVEWHVWKVLNFDAP